MINLHLREVRVDELETQVKELKDEVSELSKALEDFEKNLVKSSHTFHFVINIPRKSYLGGFNGIKLLTQVKRNIADQKLDKAIASVLLNKQEKASLYWREVVSYLDTTLLHQYLKTLVENTYLGNASNFYYVLDFLVNNELYMGFPMLYKELEQHGELQSGQEIFALATKIKSICGSDNEIYNHMPKVVRDILGGPVILKNIENMGYVMADEDNFPCENRSLCYGNNKAQVFVYHLPLTTTVDDLKSTPRAQWQFVGPENITELSLGFYMKNMDKDLFFVFAQRPASAFLKEDTTLKPYYAQDMQTQFLPALVPNGHAEENLIRIGVREKFFKKISYFRGPEFPKKSMRADFSRLPIFKNEVEGFVWEVIPVSDAIDNTIEGAEMNEKCKF